MVNSIFSLHKKQKFSFYVGLLHDVEHKKATGKNFEVTLGAQPSSVWMGKVG